MTFSLHCPDLTDFHQAQLSGLPPDTTSTAGIQAAAPDLQGSMQIANQCIQDKLQHISRLEQLSAAASNRELDARRAIAMFCGKLMRYFVKATTIDLGRSTTTLGKVSSCLCSARLAGAVFDGTWLPIRCCYMACSTALPFVISYAGLLLFILQVDIDLTQEGSAKKVSRQQAQLALHPDGRFLLTNIGRRIIHVNGNSVTQHHSIHLEHLSIVNFAGIPLLFVVNCLAVHRLVARSQNLVL